MTKTDRLVTNQMSHVVAFGITFIYWQVALMRQFTVNIASTDFHNNVFTNNEIWNLEGQVVLLSP